MTAVLLLDDFFLFHEVLAPEHLGIHERFVLLCLGAGAAAYLFSFRRIIVANDCALLGVALCFLGLSAFIDLLPGRWMMHTGQWGYLAEDGPKLMGLVGWCCYYVRVSYRMVVDGLT